MLRLFCRCLPLILGPLLLGASPLLAQEDIDPPSVTNTYALEDVRVVQSPGTVIESATVVVRDGLIEAVGSDVSVPYDARRIAGDSLVVYAGFIDGLSHAGVERPETDSNEDAEEDEVDPGDPPPDKAGIQPDRSVGPLLSTEESTLQKLRKVGFTAGHVVPDGEMLPGEGAYILYGGNTANDMLLESTRSLFAQIEESSSYVYPSTEMAVLAKFRQLYREAKRRHSLEGSYAANRTGQRRPPRDPVHTALFPVLDGQTPVAFYASDALSIHRAVTLQQELDFPFILTGLGESFRTIDKLEGIEAPLFLTLDVPDAPKAPADTDTTIADTTDVPRKHYDPDVRTRSYADVPQEETNLQLRHAVERKRYYETAATLTDAGFDFGFTTREAKPDDIRENLRTMIDNGLPEETALEALTTRPASLLGLSDRLGTVEEGKIANLVVTDGSYFSEDTDVTHVFVDGQPYDYSSEAAEGEITGDVSAVVGTWAYTLESPRGEQSGTLTLEGDQSGLEGTLVGPDGDEQDIESISFDGTTLSFSVPNQDGPALSVSVTVEGDSFEGSVSTPGPTLSITGERTGTPGR